MKIEVSATARLELGAAAGYYYSIHPSLSHRFLQEFERILELISSYPQLYRRTSLNLHIASFHTFPYELYYRCSKSTAEVIRVLPARLAPYTKNKRLTTKH